MLNSKIVQMEGISLQIEMRCVIKFLVKRYWNFTKNFSLFIKNSVCRENLFIIGSDSSKRLEEKMSGILQDVEDQSKRVHSGCAWHNWRWQTSIGQRNRHKFGNFSTKISFTMTWVFKKSKLAGSQSFNPPGIKLLVVCGQRVFFKNMKAIGLNSKRDL
jgi:hypothetical protein